MVTRAPLTVRLSTPDTQQAFDVRDVQFSRSWRGGFKDASITLSAPLNFRHPMLSPFARIRIDDDRTGQTVWGGYLDLPGRSRSDEGDVWQIGAVGGFARLADRRKPYVVIDRHFENWGLGRRTNGNMTAGQEEHPDNNDQDVLLLNWPNGIPVANGSLVSLRYTLLNEAGQFVGGFSVTHDDGAASTDNRFQVTTQTVDVGGSFEIVRDRALTTSPDVTDGAVGATGGGIITLGRDQLGMRRFRNAGGATNVATDSAWCAVTDIRVSALRRDINGNWITGNIYKDDFVLCHDVVTDMLTWFAPPIDKAAASIDATFDYQIDHMSYTEPTTMQAVLDDLALMNPTMVWEVLETTATGNHRFNLRNMSSSVRYMATAEDGWDAPGGENDLRNEVVVSWRDRRGQVKSRSYSTAVPALDQWGIIRDADIINLSDELGSAANADRIGPQILAEVSMPPDTGTLTVARPIRDLWSGRDVWPWEIEAGYRILIEDVDIDPQPITEVAYRDSEATAALTVGEPVLTTDQIVALYSKRRRRRG